MGVTFGTWQVSSAAVTFACSLPRMLSLAVLRRAKPSRVVLCVLFTCTPMQARAGTSQAPGGANQSATCRSHPP